MDALPRRWPNDSETVRDVRTLTSDCGGFFIYAAMTLPFIFDDRARNPPRQLKILVNRKFGARNPYAALDGRYLRVLQGAVSEYSTEGDVKRVQQAIATMIAYPQTYAYERFSPSFCIFRSMKFAMPCTTYIPSS